MNAEGIASHPNVEAEPTDVGALLRLQQALAEAVHRAGTTETALQSVVDLICEHTGWQVGHAILVQQGLVVAANIWHLESPRKYTPLSEAIATANLHGFGASAPFSERTLRTRQAVWLESFAAEAEVPWLQAAREVELQSGGAWPICAGQDLMAVLEFYSAAPITPDEPLLQVFHFAELLLGLLTDSQRAKQARPDSGVPLPNLPNEVASQANEALFHQMGEVIGQIFWLADPLSTRITYVSPAYEEIWGCSRGQLYESPMSWWDAIHPEDRQRVISSLPQPVMGKYSVEYRIVRPDGTVRWIWDRRFPVRDATGTIYQVAGVAKDITERRIAQLALRESEEKYRLLIELSPDALYVQVEGHIVLINPAGIRLLGAERSEQIVGKPVLDFVHPDYREAVAARMKQTGSGQTVPPLEEKYLRLDGSAIDVEVVAAPLPYLDQRAVQVIVRDITERKRVEEAADREHGLLRTLIDTIPDRIYVKDTQARFILNNIAHIRALGAASQEEVKGKTDFDFRPSDIATERLADDKRVLESGEPLYNREEATIRADGKEGWNLVNKVPLRDAHGNIIGLVGVSRDITERKLAEEETDRDRNLLRTLIETIPDRIYAKDVEARFILNNIAHLQALGSRSQEETVGKTDFDFRAPEVASSCMADDQQVLQSGQPLHNREEQTKLADGQPGWILVNKVPLRDPDGNIIGLVGISRDITQRKQADEKLRTYAAKLERSNRDLQDFAYIASHDLQEPLRKIQAFGDRLKAKYNDVLGDTGRDYLARMFDAAGRMQTLINDLLSFSRVTTKAQPFAPIELDKVLREVLSDLEVRIEQTHGRVEAAALGTIEADALQMRQLFQNLIGNALKFHKPDVPPVIRIQSQRMTDDSPPSIEITFVDNGIGFDQKYADRIFVIFQRLHGRSQYEGTGVGLAVCKKIVERHGGTISAESKEGEGATFRIVLPVNHAKGEQTT